MSTSLDIDVARILGLRVVKDETNHRGWQIGSPGRRGTDLPYFSEDDRQIRKTLDWVCNREDTIIERYVACLYAVRDPRGLVTNDEGFHRTFLLMQSSAEEHRRALVACDQSMED